MTPLHSFIYVVEYVGSGVVAGAASTAFGIGGAALSTPLIRVFGVPATLAVATTLPSILPGSLVGWFNYRNAGIIRYSTVVRVVPSGLVGAVVGSELSHVVPGHGHVLMVATATIIGMLAIRMLRTGGAALRVPTSHGTNHLEKGTPLRRSVTGHELAALVSAGLLAGLLSGLLGLGGGIVLVPAFVELLGFPIKEAIATSLICVGCLAVPSTIVHGIVGDVDWTVALLLAVGTIPAARVGARIALAAQDGRLQMAMGVLLLVVAVVYGTTELVAALGA